MPKKQLSTEPESGERYSICSYAAALVFTYL